MKLYIEPCLLEGKELRAVHFVRELGGAWILSGGQSQMINFDECIQIAREEALIKYPELEELLDLNPDRNVFFLKGAKSGKWIDFV